MLVICPECHARYRIDPSAWPVATRPEDGDQTPAFLPRKAHCHNCDHVWQAVPEDELLELMQPLPDIETRQQEDDPQPNGLPPEDEQPEEQSRRRLWPMLLLSTLALVLVAFALLATGVVRPERHGIHGLPDMQIDMTRLPILPDIRLPEISLPAFDMPDIRLPEWADPSRLGLLPAKVRVPSTPPPPLLLEIKATRQKLDDGQQIWNVHGRLSNPTAIAHDVPMVELMLVDSAGRRLTSWTTRPDATRIRPGASLMFETSAVDPPPAAVRLRARLKPQGIGRM